MFASTIGAMSAGHVHARGTRSRGGSSRSARCRRRARSGRRRRRGSGGRATPARELGVGASGRARRPPTRRGRAGRTSAPPTNPVAPVTSARRAASCSGHPATVAGARTRRPIATVRSVRERGPQPRGREHQVGGFERREAQAERAPSVAPRPRTRRRARRPRPRDRAAERRAGVDRRRSPAEHPAVGHARSSTTPSRASHEGVARVRVAGPHLVEVRASRKARVARRRRRRRAGRASRCGGRASASAA